VKVNKFISEIFSADWMMERQAAKSYLPMLMNILDGTMVTEFEEIEPKTKTFSFSAATNSYTVYGPNTAGQLLNDPTVENATVIIPIQDVITKNDSWCSYGSMTWASVIATLSASEKISTIIMDTDSPGGSVAGTQTFADAIKASSKKTIAYINEGMAASAAYWLASSCDEIYVAKKTDAVGSIGVYVTMADMKKYWEGKGLVIKEIYSRHSPEKNKIYQDALDGDEEALKDRLDYIAELFINHVKENRTIDMSVADPFKGAMYFAEEALAIGLIDGIKSLDAILAETTPKTTTNTKKREMKISEQIAILTDATSTEEQITAATAALTAAYEAEEVITQEEVDAAVALATADMHTPEQVTEQVSAATKTLSDRITALETENTELKKAAREKTEIDAEGEEAQFGDNKDFTPTIKP
jgi:ClpP class serine protease